MAIIIDYIYKTSNFASYKHLEEDEERTKEF